MVSSQAFGARTDRPTDAEVRSFVPLLVRRYVSELQDRLEHA